MRLLVNLFVFAVTFCLVSAQSQCPYNAQPYNGGASCLLIIPNVAIFNTAEKNCRIYGGHLVSVHDAFNNNLLRSQAAGQNLQDGQAFLGLYRNTTSGPWKWTDGTTANYFKWAPGQPGTDNCAYLNVSNSTWATANCGYGLGYACQLPMPAPVTPCPAGTTVSKNVAIVWDLAAHIGSYDEDEASKAFVSQYLLTRPEWQQPYFSVIPFPDPVDTGYDNLFKTPRANVGAVMQQQFDKSPKPFKDSDIKSALVLLDQQPSVANPAVILFLNWDFYVKAAQATADDLKKKYGYTIYCVGVGNPRDFGTLPSDPANVFTMQNFDNATLTTLADMLTRRMLTC